MMRAGVTALLLAAFGLTGCDRLTGEADQKIFDAEAIGYACRVSMKKPEDCMQENEGHSPTYVLSGWKKANKDIEDNVIDPSMGKGRPVTQAAPLAPAVSAAPEAPAATDKGAAKPGAH
jgi:hypothetical protein